MKALAALALLLAVPAAAQGGPVLLRWQVPADGPLAFRTVLRAAPADTAASLFQTIERADMTAVLRGRPDGEVDVEVVQGDVTFADGAAPLQELLESMETLREAMGDAQLRARITPAGAITSFWLKQEQKNLVSLFFELPADSVAVGDAWALDGTSLLFLSGPFRVEAAERTNRVRLVALEGGPDRPVAVLEYDVRERVEGDFGRLAFAFEGRGEFDVAAGAWRRFGGRMTAENTVMGAQRTTQIFALDPIADGAR